MDDVLWVSIEYLIVITRSTVHPTRCHFSKYQSTFIILHVDLFSSKKRIVTVIYDIKIKSY